jgi:hypothetical protein
MSTDGLYAERAQKARRQRVADFATFLQNMEGQSLDSAMKAYSRQTGISMRTLGEYWEVLNPDNKGPIYEKHGLIRVRHRRGWMK